MNTELIKERRELLTHWAASLWRAAQAGQLVRGKAVQLLPVQTVNGPRAGAVELNAGIQTGALARLLSANDAALARQFVPFWFDWPMSLYMRGQYLRIEVGWPQHLADSDIKLSDVNRRGAMADGRWLIGISENGGGVTGSFYNAAHWLLAGTTGSGKTVELVAACAQWLQAGDVRLILIDGKGGEDLRGFERAQGLIGPIVHGAEDAARALAWAVAEMERRYAHPSGDYPRIVVVIDEVQNFAEHDPFVVAHRRLAKEGRAARVHVMSATQRPTLDMFGSNDIKSLYGGRLALRVTSSVESQVALDCSDKRADRLMGRGDGYALNPTGVQRVQVAYAPESLVRRLARSDYYLSDWPEIDAEGLGREIGDAASALINAAQGGGRPALQAMLGGAGSKRAEKLLRWGRDVVTELRERGWALSGPACLPPVAGGGAQNGL